jgi:two-component system response regulator CpxR
VASVLLIDDDRELCAMLRDYLGRHGFQVTVDHHGETGLQRAQSGRFAIVLLDVMLPGMDGFEVLRRLRTSSQVSVLLLTARGEDVDRIVGLEIGADDYLPKPFNPRELLARMRAVLRRNTASEPIADATAHAHRLSVSGLELDTGSRSAQYKGSDLALTDVEFALLEALMQAPGQVLTREHLVESVLGRSFNPFDRSLDMHVSRLRRKLDDVAGIGDRIKTVRSVGYQLAVATNESILGSDACSEDSAGRER